jgi:hypothetical protein
MFWFQGIVREYTTRPVLLSSLVQLPSITCSLGRSGQVRNFCLAHLLSSVILLDHKVHVAGASLFCLNTLLHFYVQKIENRARK